jgi:hypothetical protein
LFILIPLHTDAALVVSKSGDLTDNQALPPDGPGGAAGASEVRMLRELKCVAMLAAVAACAQPTDSAVPPADRDKDIAMTDEAPGEGGVRNLPSSYGRSFASLDEYLEHLRRYAGPVDQPWYREVRPGVYELVTTMRPAPAPRTFTREQLMRQFGFTR